MEKTRRLPNGCWLWTAGRSGGRRGRRYATIMVNGRMENVRRLLYSLTAAFPPLDPARELEGTCGTIGCINPDHLRPGKPKGGRRPIE